MSSKPARYSPATIAGSKCEKAAGIRRLFLHSERLKASAARLEPLRVTSATVIPARSAIPIVAVIAVAAIRAMLESMVLPASAELASHMGQDGKAAFLAVVEGLVERVGRVSDTLHRRRRGCHGVGAFAQARHRIVGVLRILLIIRLSLYPRIG